jgi:hypothetical protein
MTPQEKAKELYSNYLGLLIKNSNTYIDNGITEEQAKQCALIAVDEIMQHAENSYYNKDIINGAKLYWQEVKQEIGKL